VFVIASSGRCGTLALCRGLDEFGDHTVEHEPEPRLLREAYLKHTGADHRTETYRERLAFFAERDGTAYGQSFRAPTLLDDVAEAAPQARFLVLVRDPLEYVVSAHFMKVLARGDEWDAMRIMPPGSDELSHAERLAAHWTQVNRYLLDFAEREPGQTRVAIVAALEEKIEPLAEHLGVRIERPDEVRTLLAARPNAATNKAVPEGMEHVERGGAWEPVWEEARSLASL
jgi:hypothetical protein